MSVCDNLTVKEPLSKSSRRSPAALYRRSATVMCFRSSLPELEFGCQDAAEAASSSQHDPCVMPARRPVSLRLCIMYAFTDANLDWKTWFLILEASVLSRPLTSERFMIMESPAGL